MQITKSNQHLVVTIDDTSENSDNQSTTSTTNLQPKKALHMKQYQDNDNESVYSLSSNASDVSNTSSSTSSTTNSLKRSLSDCGIPSKRRKYSKQVWSSTEDEILRNAVAKYGERSWSKISELLPGRVGKQCRDRWCNHLSGCVYKGGWSNEEDTILFQAQQELGNQWAEIARKYLPGRTDLSVKNRYYSTIRKVNRQLAHAKRNTRPTFGFQMPKPNVFQNAPSLGAHNMFSIGANPATALYSQSLSNPLFQLGSQLPITSILPTPNLLPTPQPFTNALPTAQQQQQIFQAAAAAAMLTMKQQQQQQQQSTLYGTGRFVDLSQALQSSLSRTKGNNGRRPINGAIPGTENTGRWTPEEHSLFLEGMKIHGERNWTAIANHVATRTVIQVRTHAQKYFKKLKREQGNSERKQDSVIPRNITLPTIIKQQNVGVSDDAVRAVDTKQLVRAESPALSKSAVGLLTLSRTVA